MYVDLVATNGVDVEYINTFSDLQFSTARDGTGVINVTIPAQFTGMLLSGTDLNEGALLEVRPNGITSAPNMLYELTSFTAEYGADGAKLIQFSGKTIADRLNDATVYPSTWPDVPTRNPDGTLATVIQGHSFQDATPGTIIQTLVARAQERGGLLWLNVSTFSGIATSGGGAWAATLTTTYTNGTGLLQVLQDLLSRRIIDLQFFGTSLYLYNYDEVSEHILPESLMYRVGQNVAEQSRSVNAENTANTVLIVGDELAVAEVQDAGLLMSQGRRKEKFVSQGGVTDIPTLEFLAQAELDVSGRALVEDTIAVSSISGTLSPFLDYQVGDWVWVDYGADVKEAKIQQISASQQESGDYQIGLTTGDLLSDAIEIMQRKIDNIVGGSGYGALPNSVPNFASPNTPSSVVATPDAYRDSNGVDTSQVSITWVAPTGKTNGDALFDLSHYDMQYQLSDGTWSASQHVPADASPLVGYLSNVPVGENFVSRVRAVDSQGNASDWSLQTNTITALPKVVTRPPTPSRPGVSGVIQGVLVYWDGQDNSAHDMPPAFDHLEIYLDTTGTGFTPSAANLQGSMSTSGAFTIGQLDPSITYWAKFIAIDKSGNTSFASVASLAIVPRSVTTSDMDSTSSKNTYVNEPSVAKDGDLWFDNANNNQINRWNSGSGSWGVQRLGFAALKVDNWQTITLASGVSNVSGTARFFRDGFGIIHVEGYVSIPSGSSALFTFPTDHRPGQLLVFGGYTSGGTHSSDAISVDTTGAVVRADTTDSVNIALTNICFLAEN